MYIIYIIPTTSKLYMCYSTSDPTNCYWLRVYYTAQCTVTRGDTTLYRISGWDCKSAIDLTSKYLRRKTRFNAVRSTEIT